MKFNALFKFDTPVQLISNKANKIESGFHHMGHRRIAPLLFGLAAVLLVFSAGFGRKFLRRVCGRGKRSKTITYFEELSNLTMSMSEVENVIRKLADTTVDDENEVSFAGQGLKLDTEGDAQVVVNEIRQCQDMTVLCMEGNTVGVEAAKAIAKALEGQKHFRRALWKDMFTGRLKTEIPDALNFLSGGIMLAKAQLVELDLSDNAFGPVGVKGIVTLLKSTSCQTLEILRLNNNGLGISGGKLLAQALQHNADKNATSEKKFALKTFICGRNRLENEGAIAIAAVLKTLGSLEEVAMPQNGIYHPGISAIAEALSHSPQLKVINFNDNTFTELGAKAFAKNMVSLQNLEIINFGDCLLKTEGALAIAEALKDKHVKLKEVHLGFNEIGQAGGVAIVEAMENKMRLQRLEINGNGFGTSGCEIIEGTMDAFGLSSQLGSLSDDEGAEDENEDSEDHGDDDDDEEEDEDETEESLDSSNQSQLIEENNTLHSNNSITNKGKEMETEDILSRLNLLNLNS